MTKQIDNKTFWQKEERIFRQIYQLGIEKYFNFFIPNIYWAFSSNHNAISCMDEGISDGKLRVGGSGIFEFNDQTKLLNLLISANIDVITTHSDCGGARLAYSNKFNIEPEAISDDAIEQYTINWGKELTSNLNELYKNQNKYKQVFYQHLGIKEMTRPKGFHPARMLYINTTRSPFNPNRVIGLPSGYVISRGYLTREQTQNFASRCLAISFGKYGFGDWLTEDNPFIVNIIIDALDKNCSLPILIDEIKTVTKAYGNRVAIGSFASNWIGFNSMGKQIDF